MSLELRTLRADEVEEAFALDRQAFNTPADRRERFVSHIEPERMHGAFADGRLAAMTYVYPFRQFFGGRAVPMGGLSSVATAPEHRGRGLASRTIRAALAAMASRGEVISALYPASTQLYRRLGWELAGVHGTSQLRTAALLGVPAAEGRRVRRASRDDLPGMRACYARIARPVNGLLDLDDAQWEWRLQWGDDHYIFVSVAADTVDGYAYYCHLTRPDGQGFTIDVRQQVAETADAARALWRVIGSSATQAEQVRLRGPREHPLLLLLPEQWHLEPLVDVRWMLRLVDAAGAIGERGFARGLALRVDLELDDPILAHNRGRFVLEVADGRGRLEPGGAGTLRLGVGAFASLYSGWATSHTLAANGLLEGGGDAERDAVDAAFAGPTPVLLDEF